MFIACNTERAFFTDESYDKYTNWTCEQVCDSLVFLLDNIFVNYADSIYQQVIGIPMGTNCAPLIADLFLYCYESDFMSSLNSACQSDIINAFNDSSRYLQSVDAILNIDNSSFDDEI